MHLRKRNVFSEVALRRLQVRGLAILKIKEFTFVNDCFQDSRNEEIGVFLEPLNKVDLQIL